MWEITALAHAVLLLAYLVIAYIIGRGQTIERQWVSNPLASATFMIFLTCAISHGIHLEHTLFDFEPATTEAARTALSDPLLVIWTPITAATAIFYLLQRKRLPILQGGAPMVVDLEKRRAEAAILHDEVMASVGAAQGHLDAGRREDAEKEIEAAMHGAEEIITALLGERKSVHKVRPGDLRRSQGSR